MSDLAKNLQFLSRRSRSVSELCRELNINRQQFARYLSGAGKPSQFNLTKIADRFSLPIADLSLPHSKFLELHSTTGRRSSSAYSHPVCEALSATSESNELLKNYAGYYWVYLQSPSEPSRLLRSIVHMYVDGGRLMCVWEGSFTRTEDGSVQTSRYEGLGRFFNGYLFIVDVEVSVGDRIFETILRIPQRRRTDILTGLTLGMTTGWHRLPFASIVVFKYLGKKIDWTVKRRQCGFHDIDSSSVEPNVRNVFSHQKVSHVYPEVFERFLM